ncbi:hypothetical protein TRFO_25638 [Tritrichomonas foetus]|uniref:Uncharacterized protein n=1 Tax=Tritrichomonas foetus TaxID=1144522 RepID=A0A1J4K4J2_9EUKA|nr:hypothetical protein TRFO_25638 [Tritrichomonas foetus]|eukprot:OHT06303.1 hypothetical protein TRFO_25638 [Tritrichomonas foetus]
MLYSFSINTPFKKFINYLYYLMCLFLALVFAIKGNEIASYNGVNADWSNHPNSRYPIDSSVNIVNIENCIFQSFVSTENMNGGCIYIVNYDITFKAQFSSFHLCRLNKNTDFDENSKRVNCGGALYLNIYNFHLYRVCGYNCSSHWYQFCFGNSGNSITINETTTSYCCPENLGYRESQLYHSPNMIFRNMNASYNFVEFYGSAMVIGDPNNDDKVQICDILYCSFNHNRGSNVLYIDGGNNVRKIQSINFIENTISNIYDSDGERYGILVLLKRPLTQLWDIDTIFFVRNSGGPYAKQYSFAGGVVFSSVPFTNCFFGSGLTFESFIHVSEGSTVGTDADAPNYNHVHNGICVAENPFPTNQFTSNYKTRNMSQIRWIFSLMLINI